MRCASIAGVMSGRGRGRGRGRRVGRGRGRGGSNYNRPSSGLFTQFHVALRRRAPEGPRLPARIPKTERNQPLLVTAQGTPTPTLCNPPFAELPSIADRPVVTVEVLSGGDAAVVTALRENHGFPNPTFTSTCVSLSTPAARLKTLQSVGRAVSLLSWRTSNQLDAKGRRERDFDLEGPQLARNCAWCLDRLDVNVLYDGVFCSIGCKHVCMVLDKPPYAAQCIISRDGNAHGDLHCPMCNSLEWRPPSMDSCTFQVDHIIGVAEGGGCCYLDNLRALCHACHEKKTTEDRDAF